MTDNVYNDLFVRSTLKLACPPTCPPTVLTQKCQFCNFHVVFGHFVQIVPPNSQPHLGTL